MLEPQECDDAIIGITNDGCIIYSYNKLLDVYVEQLHYSVDDARDYIDYNVISAHFEHAPIIMLTIDELDDLKNI